MAARRNAPPTVASGVLPFMMRYAMERLLRAARSTRHRLTLEPLRDVARDGDGYRVTGASPRLRLSSDRTRLPHGWISIDRAPAELSRFLLFVEASDAGREPVALSVAEIPALLRLPRGASGLFLSPQRATEVVPVQPLEIRELSGWHTLRALAQPYLARLRRDPGLAGHFARRALAILLGHGGQGLYRTLTARVPRFFEQDYAQWVRRHDTLTAADEAAIREHVACLAATPTFAVIAGLEGSSAKVVERLILSLRAQLYPRWELYLVAARALAPECRDVIERQREADQRIRFLAADSPTAALAETAATFTARVAPTAELAPHALYLLAVEIDADPQLRMLYGDEDRIDDQGRRSSPLFKPRWNPELLENEPYTGTFTVYRTDLLREIGAWRAEAGNGADWDLALRAAAAAGERVRHVPFVLYHAAAPSIGPAAPASRVVLEAHAARRGSAADVCRTEDGEWRMRYRLPEPSPPVSIIVPTHDGFRLLRALMESLRQTRRPSYELLIIDHRSEDPATLDYLAALAGRGEARIVHFREPFNFSAMNNVAAGEARGSVFAFLNDDIEIIDGDWLAEMSALALRPEVGAVGAKLYYPDGTIQHAGMVLGLGGVVGHAYRGLRESPAGSSYELDRVREVAAVSAACLVVRADLYRSVGGLDAEHLPVAFNDVDLCLKLRRAGYRIVWTPHARLYHHESATIGRHHDAASAKRFRAEEKVMRRRWGALLRSDPFCNPNLELTDPLLPLAPKPRVEKPWR